MKTSTRLKDFRDPDVRRKQYIKKTCPGCGEIFDLPPHVAKRWRHCSHSCASSIVLVGLKKAPRENRKCPICGSVYTRTEKDALANRRATCSYECGLEATRRSRIIDPNGFPKTRKPQRRKTLESRQKCDHCGYDEIIDILVIHHIDHNPFNGDSQNILLLCPMCHALEHYRLKTGWFTKTKHGFKIPVNLDIP
jgi:predicted RNA-binding Zn-ribbon protein involved in translation (DUF1610 family)